MPKLIDVLEIMTWDNTDENGEIRMDELRYIL